MNNSIKSKPTGGGKTAQITQPPAGLTPQTKQVIIGLLSRAQVARRLGVCTHTVARNPNLTPLKFNSRLVRYRAEDVERFIQSAITGTKGI